MPNLQAHLPHIYILLESLHKHGCFTYFLSGANAFRPLPFFMQVVCGHTLILFFLFYGLEIISPLRVLTNFLSGIQIVP